MDEDRRSATAVSERRAWWQRLTSKVVSVGVERGRDGRRRVAAHTLRIAGKGGAWMTCGRAPMIGDIGMTVLLPVHV